MNAMKELVANAQTPWPQIFLIKNLCNNYGFIPAQKILKAEKWILPRGFEISQVSVFQNLLHVTEVGPPNHTGAPRLFFATSSEGLQLANLSPAW